jgi:hypothetical protein
VRLFLIEDFHSLLLSYVCDQVSLLLRESFIGSFPYRDRAFMKVQTDNIAWFEFGSFVDDITSIY